MCIYVYIYNVNIHEEFAYEKLISFLRVCYMYINTVGDCKKYLLVKHNFLEGEFGISNKTKTKIRFTKAMLMHMQHR